MDFWLGSSVDIHVDSMVMNGIDHKMYKTEINEQKHGKKLA